MALRAGYYGVKRFLRDKLETIAKTYDETIKSLFPRSEQIVLGASNLFHSLKGTIALTGFTITKNADGIVTVVGSRDVDAWIDFTDGGVNLGIPSGDYYFKGCPAGGSATTYSLILVDMSASGTPVIARDYGDGVSVNIDDTHNYKMQFAVKANNTLNLTVKPQISLSLETPYAPYAMTNRELTTSAADQKTAINAIITAATEAADFAAFKTAMGAITPVTRSLSLTKEDITEEVKEVEPEKTVTKKRTTKKTEEV